MPKQSDDYMAQRRRHIIEAAMHCFGQKGVSGTSMRDICKAAGLSAGAVYCHFENKQAIINSAFMLGQQRLQQLTQGDEKSSTLEPQKLMDDIVQALFHRYDAAEGRLQLAAVISLIAECVRNATICDHYRAQTAHMHAGLTPLVAALQQQGAISRRLSPTATAQMMLCIFEGFRVQKLVQPDLDTTAFVQAMQALFAPLKGE